MDLREIDQIKKAEQEAEDQIAAARHRMILATEETVREGDDHVKTRLLEAEEQLKREKKAEEDSLRCDRAQVMAQAEQEVQRLQDLGKTHTSSAVARLVCIITGEEPCFIRHE